MVQKIGQPSIQWRHLNNSTRARMAWLPTLHSVAPLLKLSQSPLFPLLFSLCFSKSLSLPVFHIQPFFLCFPSSPSFYQPHPFHCSSTPCSEEVSISTITMARWWCLFGTYLMHVAHLKTIEAIPHSKACF